MKPVAYLSFDVETDGPTPLKNSLLSVGIVIFDEDSTEISSLKVNIKRRPAGVENPATMKWWNTQPDAWTACHLDVIDPGEAMYQIAKFIRVFSGLFELRWVAGPAAFDWMFLKCYYDRYGPPDRPDIGYSCHCLSEVKRICHDLLEDATIEQYLSSATPALSHTHDALDDAREQGYTYLALRQLLRTVIQKK